MMELGPAPRVRRACGVSIAAAAGSLRERSAMAFSGEATGASTTGLLRDVVLCVCVCVYVYVFVSEAPRQVVEVVNERVPHCLSASGPSRRPLSVSQSDDAPGEATHVVVGAQTPPAALVDTTVMAAPGSSLARASAEVTHAMGASCACMCVVGVVG